MTELERERDRAPEFLVWFIAKPFRQQIPWADIKPYNKEGWKGIVHQTNITIMKDITNDGVANGHEPTHVEETSEVGQSIMSIMETISC